MTRHGVWALTLVLASAFAVVPHVSGETTTLLLSYEAPTLEVKTPTGWTRGPHASGWDPAGVTADGRTDVGRLFAAVPAGSLALDLTVADTAMPSTPLRYEWFKADGASAGGSDAVCATRYAPLPVTVPPESAFLVIWLHAASPAGDVGACPTGTVAGASTGDVILAFHT